MAEQISYTQVVDEKSGEIKYVPNTPPLPPPAGRGHNNSDEDEDKTQLEKLFDAVRKGVSLDTDEKLADVLKGLEDNNKRLRYAIRLKNGKLDTRRLCSYKTSDRIFRKKDIKHKDYQFTIMLDTSGSMLSAPRGDDYETYDDEFHEARHSKLAVAVDSITKVVKALETLKIPVAIWAMNTETRLLKEFNTPFNYEDFMRRLKLNTIGEGNSDHNMGGTNEITAYKEAIAYIDRCSKPKQKNVVLVLSDGEPGGRSGEVPVFLEDETEQFRPSGNDSTDSLRNYWEQQSKVTAYGIGIMSSAKQIPRSKRLDSVDKLPEVISNLIQEIIM